MTKEYDVAISFIAADEPFANDLRNALQPPLKVFVYSKRQEELAGKDGIEAFRTVFREKAQLVVVLFRPPWGETPWTRVEKTAVEELCLDDGWEHLVFVKLDQSAVPKWVPKPHLYLDFERFTMPDLVGATKARLVELGVEIVKPSAAERAGAVRRQRAFDKETEQLLSGSEAFNEASSALCDSIATIAKQIAEQTGWPIKTGHGYYIGGFLISGEGKTLQLVSKDLYSNTARDAYIELFEFDYSLPIAEPDVRYNLTEDHLTNRSVGRADIRRLPDTGWCWQLDDRVYPIKDAAEAMVNLFLDMVETRPRRR